MSFPLRCCVCKCLLIRDWHVTFLWNQAFMTSGTFAERSCLCRGFGYFCSDDRVRVLRRMPAGMAGVPDGHRGAMWFWVSWYQASLDSLAELHSAQEEVRSQPAAFRGPALLSWWFAAVSEVPMMACCFPNKIKVIVKQRQQPQITNRGALLGTQSTRQTAI